MTTPATPDGLLLVDKPAGMSSHDAVLIARRAVGEKRAGHAGTLDPFATGLLVVLFGRATRLLRWLPGEPKVYEARVLFGAETDTEDPLGVVTRTVQPPLRSEFEAAMTALTGDIEHVPSAYSAKRVDGRRAYVVARGGGEVALASVRITVHRWEILETVEAEGRLAQCDVRVTCSGGTYVRALARDAGRLAGSAAHLGALRRIASGPFHVREALTIDDLRSHRVTLRPALDALPQLPRQSLTVEELHAVVQGIGVEARVDGELAALVNGVNGVLVALAEREQGRWQPRVVMRPALEPTP
jgi:tRNA pseudouridine55 synthase